MELTEFNVKATAEVSVADVAKVLGNMTSDQQAGFLHELFDALKHECNDLYNFDQPESLGKLVEFMSDTEGK